MANLSWILYALGVLAVFITSRLCEHTHEKHIIHVPIFIHYVHHHHILKNKIKPRKKWKRVRPRVPPVKYIRHYHSSNSWY